MKANQHSEKFGCLSYAKRVWAISCVHGEADKLRQLHEIMANRWQQGDRIVYLGNYLGRGDNIIGVLNEMLRFRIDRLCLPGMMPEDIVYLRGAQEEMWRKLLQIQLATEPSQVFDWMIEHGIAGTLEAYGESEAEARAYFREGILATTRWTGRLREKIQSHPGHNDILISLRRAAYTMNGELLFVHAGIDPSRPVTEQSDTFWWGSGYFDKIEEPYSGFKKVIRGFDRTHEGVTETEHTVSLDSGCGFDGPLTSACFTLDGEIDDLISSD
jgi:serine/threonine protein phosphatase 1